MLLRVVAVRICFLCGGCIIYLGRLSCCIFGGIICILIEFFLLWSAAITTSALALLFAALILPILLIREIPTVSLLGICFFI